MRRLIALYPRAWRDRYGAELSDLLDARPAGLLDHLDILRGALDAWTHPQVRGRAVHPTATVAGRPRPWATAPAILGGVLLIAGGVGMRVTERDAILGYKQVDVAFAALILGMILVSLAAIIRSGRRGADGRATTAAVAMLAGALVTATPWPFLAIGFFGFALASMLFGALVALRDHQPVGFLIALGAIALLGLNTEDDRALWTIPIAAVWILVGLLDLRPTPAPDRGIVAVRDPATP